MVRPSPSQTEWPVRELSSQRRPTEEQANDDTAKKTAADGHEASGDVAAHELEHAKDIQDDR